MADNGRKSTADGKRPLAESRVTEEEAAKRCDVCHGPLKPPVYQLGASGRSQCSSPRRVACSDCGAAQRRSSANLAEEAVDVVSRHLGYYMVPCPYAAYGCARSVVSRDAAAHAAVCAHAPCACKACSFEGSPAQLVRHLTNPAGVHRWTATKVTYGKEFPFTVNMLEEPRQDRRLLVAEEDGAVFLLALDLGGHGQDPHSGRTGVVCVRGNADAGQVYSSSVVVAGQVCTTLVMPSCSAPGEFDVDAAPCDADYAVFPFLLQGEETKELHLRVRIDRQAQGYRGIPIRIRLPC